MCGIAGFVSSRPVSGAAEILTRMGQTLVHRGPDDKAEWMSEDSRVGLAHRRLSILDLSARGRQPMWSESGRSAIVYNGEVYNFQEVARELSIDSSELRTGTDTEVILLAIERLGLERALAQFNGMFAFGFWDQEHHELLIARDRLGIKPLYYYYNAENSSFAFASELNAILEFSGASLTLDQQALASYLGVGYLSAPDTIYRDVKKLLPGSYLRISFGTDSSLSLSEPTLFWSVADTILAARKRSFQGDDEAAISALDAELQAAVHRRLISDVPLGAFLSGGTDSSLVVALMQKLSSKPVKTFSIGFDIPQYNEQHYARQVATHLSTDHTELILDGTEALAFVDSISTWFSEPFADPSAIPTFLVSRLARESVTVSLSGDGGDELFAGYNRYQYPESIWRTLSLVPRPLRLFGSSALRLLSPSAYDVILGQAQKLLRQGRRFSLLGDKLHKLGRAASACSLDEFYSALINPWPKGVLPLMAETLRTRVSDQFQNYQLPSGLKFAEQQMAKDAQIYLVDDLLAKVDRTSMAVSLEARVPILDHEVFTFAWSLPQHFKLREGQTKWILKKLLCRYLPVDLVYRPKMGFSVPIDSWLRGPLKAWGGDLLSSEALSNLGLFDVEYIQRLWSDHQSGQANNQYALWSVLMFQSWHGQAGT